MREVRKRQKSNIKELILSHIYDNIKQYLIVIIIFVIGIIVGVVFINNTNGEEIQEIQNYISNFINRLKEECRVDPGALL